MCAWTWTFIWFGGVICQQWWWLVGGGAFVSLILFVV